MRGSPLRALRLQLERQTMDLKERSVLLTGAGTGIGLRGGES